MFNSIVEAVAPSKVSSCLRHFYRPMYLLLSTVFFIQAQYPASIKVLTYNINAEKHGSGSYDDIVTVIKELNPDIAGFQKIDSCNSRNSTDVLQWMAENTERSATFAPAIKNYENSNGSYGVGFLSKEPPVAVRRLWIPHTASEQDRGVAELSITMAGEKVRILVTHLAHEGASYRTSQIETILSWMEGAGSEDPVIIMADFNAAPTESSMQQFETAGFAYVKGKNGAILDTSTGQKINHILYRPESSWKIVDAGNPAYAASNRNPVWAEMQLITTKIRTEPIILQTVHTPMVSAAPHSRLQLDLAGRSIPGTLNSRQIFSGSPQLSIIRYPAIKKGERYSYAPCNTLLQRP